MVSDSLSETRRDGLETIPPKTYTEQFHQIFPYYLSIGMSYDQFWNDDPTLVKAYRKAEELRTEKLNQQLWLQGMYVYDAICCASPILHAFAKKGVKAVPYPKEPYPITQKQNEKKKTNAEKMTFDKGLARMRAFMASNNKRFENKDDIAVGGEANGNDDRFPAN